MNIEIIELEGPHHFGPSSFNELYILDLNFFPRPWRQDDWLNIDLQNHSLWLIQIENKLEGFILYFKIHADSFAHLFKILINPIFRGNGIGDIALKKSINELNKKGINNFFLEVEEDNLSAQKLYLKNNFKIIHRKKGFYSDGQNALIMSLSM